MVDLITLLYFFYGLFYVGTQFNKINEFVEFPEEDETILHNGKATSIIAIMVILCILFWPFVMGYNKNENSK